MAEVATGPLPGMELSPAVLVRLGPNGPELMPSPRAPFLRADDLGVLRGDGIFERFLVVECRPRHLSEHLERLTRSAAAVELEAPGPEAWQCAVATAIDGWRGSREWELRLVCTRGPEEGGAPTAYVFGQELNPSVVYQREHGVAALTVERAAGSGVADGAPWLLLGAKTLSYAVNVAAKRWASSRGAQDAIFVGPGGEVLEAVTSSVVACLAGRLVSPPVSVGILDSISVKALFHAVAKAGWEAAREPLDVDDLFAAEGVWLSSSLRFARVHTLDGISLRETPAHSALARLAAR